ncbi:TPA: protein-disulfide isomerase, partial [Campylobacter jejuni]|nr:protein-disulfide isomerase [Campylobacter jejuni]
MKFLIKFARSIVVFAFSASALNEGKKYVILKTLDNLLIEIFS